MALVDGAAVSTVPGTVRLRPASDADRPFLAAVYASTRQEELRVVAWSEQQKAAFLRAQFEAQDAHYRSHYHGARYQVVELDEVPVGRYYVHRTASEIRLMDIALLPQFRGRGVGGRLLGELLDEGRQRGVPVTVHVERGNPARRLYQRLGFRVVRDLGVYVFLECLPGGDGE